ncbi:MAG: methyltransferase domain-containing protein [Pseudomonadota bacterium]
MPPKDSITYAANPAISRTVNAVTEDRLLGGRVILSQPQAGYRVAIDPVLLAAAVALPEPGKADRGQSKRIADLGCGVGAAGLCLLARAAAGQMADDSKEAPLFHVTGLELDPDLAALARANAAANGFAEQFHVVEGDICAPPPGLAPAGPAPTVALAGNSFDHVICNPPYMKAGRGRPSPNPIKAQANREGSATLSDWVKGALRLLRPGGRLTMIQRADRLEELTAAFMGRAGALRLFPLWPKAGQPAKRIILQAQKGAAGPTQLLPGLILHESDGSYTVAAQAVLRDGQGLTGLSC